MLAKMRILNSKCETNCSCHRLSIVKANLEQPNVPLLSMPKGLLIQIEHIEYSMLTIDGDVFPLTPILLVAGYHFMDLFIDNGNVLQASPPYTLQMTLVTQK